MEEKKNTFVKFIKTGISVVILVLLAIFIKDNFYKIVNKAEYVYLKYIEKDIKQTLIDNEYKKNQNYEYLKIDNSTTIKNKDQIKNVIYTFLDAGYKQYIVKCDPDYLNCVSDVKDIIKNQAYLYNISSFVHPYNTFDTVETVFSSTGKITFKRGSKYTDEQIKEINKKVDEIYSKYYDPNKNTRENIKIFHDYIINNTKYDKENINSKNSSGAYGVLFDGVGICSGYTDTMQLFLEKLKVKNYRIASETHTWNLVYVEGKWYHLDLTWDDPITSDGSNKLRDTYFLIDKETLLEKQDGEHNFDESMFIEAR